MRNLCISQHCRAGVTVDADGHYGPLEQVFGGFAGVDTPIEVRIDSPDARTFSYTTVYETTKDPTNGQAFLDFTLAPR